MNGGITALYQGPAKTPVRAISAWSSERLTHRWVNDSARYKKQLLLFIFPSLNWKEDENVLVLRTFHFALYQRGWWGFFSFSRCTNTPPNLIHTALQATQHKTHYANRNGNNREDGDHTVCLLTYLWGMILKLYKRPLARSWSVQDPNHFFIMRVLCLVRNGTAC